MPLALRRFHYCYYYYCVSSLFRRKEEEIVQCSASTATANARSKAIAVNICIKVERWFTGKQPKSHPPPPPHLVGLWMCNHRTQGQWLVVRFLLLLPIGACQCVYYYGTAFAKDDGFIQPPQRLLTPLPPLVPPCQAEGKKKTKKQKVHPRQWLSKRR